MQLRQKQMKTTQNNEQLKKKKDYCVIKGDGTNQKGKNLENFQNNA